MAHFLHHGQPISPSLRCLSLSDNCDCWIKARIIDATRRLCFEATITSLRRGRESWIHRLCCTGEVPNAIHQPACCQASPRSPRHGACANCRPPSPSVAKLRSCSAAPSPSASSSRIASSVSDAVLTRAGTAMSSMCFTAQGDRPNHPHRLADSAAEPPGTRARGLARAGTASVSRRAQRKQRAMTERDRFFGGVAARPWPA
jgi:hypothetical protein